MNDPRIADHGAQTQTLSQLPLSFILNRGQMDERVRFYGRSGSASFFFARDEVVCAFVRQEKKAFLRASMYQPPSPPASLRSQSRALEEVVRLQFVGANPDPMIEGLQEMPGKVNYFIGHDLARWKKDLPTYGQVRYRELWPGIDLIYRGLGGRLKYEFTVKPGAHPRQIELAYRGIEELSISDAGELILKAASGELRDGRPVAYQEIGGRRVEVEAGFRIDSAGSMGPAFIHGFEVKRYDPGYPLILDPGLDYATFLGGSSEDWSNGIALDADGNAYVTGETRSSNFPTTSGAFNPSHNGPGDAFVVKLSRDGTTLLYATFLGGDSSDLASGIALDADGNAYVTGRTSSSSNFPTTDGAPDTSFGGSSEAFVAKLSADGRELLYATFLGGSSDDWSSGIAVDDGGNAYVTGGTFSSDFPTTVGAFDRSFSVIGDAFVAKLSADGRELLYATLLGGSGGEEGWGIALDADGNAHVTGGTTSSDFPTTVGALDRSFSGIGDAFVARLSADGRELLYATLLGGSGDDFGFGIAVDGASNVYVMGTTSSPDFPTTPGALDTVFVGNSEAFVARLSSDGTTLLYATLLGGSRAEEGWGIALDADGNAYVTGGTSSSDFSTTPGAFDRSFNGSSDAFVAKLSADGRELLYATFLGGSKGDGGFGITLKATGSTYVAYVTGTTLSSNFPTTAGALDRSYNRDNEAFVAELNLATTPGPSTYAVSGAIWDNSGQKRPVAGVRVEARDPAGTLMGTAVTDDQGRYPLDLPAGKYTLTPAKEAHIFSPASRKVTVKNRAIEKQDFTRKLFQISGMVKDKKNKPLSGVTVTLKQDGVTVANSDPTDTKGKYAMGFYNTGIYVVEPTKENSRFSPSSREVVITKGNKSGVNFKEVP